MERYELVNKLLADMTTRTCGDCDLCCTAMHIPEMDKPMGMTCPFRPADGPGCSIYGKHPLSCQTFACMWRVGKDLMPDNMRPADVGFVMSWQPEVTAKLLTVFTDPARPDAWRDHLPWFQYFATNWDVMVAIGGDNSAEMIITPKGRTYTRADNPEHFADRQVAARTDDFNHLNRNLLAGE